MRPRMVLMGAIVAVVTQLASPMNAVASASSTASTSGPLTRACATPALPQTGSQVVLLLMAAFLVALVGVLMRRGARRIDSRLFGFAIPLALGASLVVGHSPAPSADVWPCPPATTVPEADSPTSATIPASTTTVPGTMAPVPIMVVPALPTTIPATTTTAPNNPARTPTFGTPTSTSDGFTVQITNHDPAFTWTATVSAGTVTIDNSGLVTVSALTTDATQTLTVDATRVGYDDGSATVTGARQPTPSRWIGSGDFTVEFWVKPTADWGGLPRQELFVLTTPNASARLDIWYAGGAWSVYGDIPPHFVHTSASMAAPTVGAWTHVALTRQSGTMRLYVGGTKVVETTFAIDLSNLNQVQLGADPNVAGCLCFFATTLLSNVRVVDGTALYTGGSLTVPTSALTHISGTTFLLNTAIGQASAGSVELDGATYYEQTITTSNNTPSVSSFDAFRLANNAFTSTTVTTSASSPFVP